MSEEQKKAEASNDAAASNSEAEVELGDLSKELTEEEAKSVNGGKRYSY